MKTVYPSICMLSFLLVSVFSHAQAVDANQTESKVDYLEKIYFSGQNKEGLLNQIDATLQGFENKEATKSVARQYAFLSGIKAKAVSASKSCDVLELIAAGIFELDANEAIAQGIHRPSEKVSGSLNNIMSSVGGIGNAANGIGSTASSAAWSSYYLSGGNAGLFSTVGKVSSVTNAVSGAASAIGGVVNTVDQGKKLLKGLGIGGADKPCKDVLKKDIVIGPHILPPPPPVQAAATVVPVDTIAKKQANVTEITIQNATELSKWKPLADLLSSSQYKILEKNTANGTAHIRVQHDGVTIDQLAELIDSKLNSKYAVKDYGDGKILIVVR